MISNGDFTQDNDWTLGGGGAAGDGNRHETGNMGAVSPSQKHDGIFSPENLFNGNTNADTPAPVTQRTHIHQPDDSYSGFKTAFAGLGEKLLDPVSVERELLWQDAAFKENTEKSKEFWDQAIQLQHFRAFALMRVDSPYITICHSIGKFFDPTGDLSKGWQGKYVGFVGDRKIGRNPFALVLPEAAWTWTVPIIESLTDLIREFY